jgi:uncharacterized protein
MYKYAIFSFCLLFFASCKDRQNDPCASSFDQSAMLQNVGNNIILPRYTQFSSDVNALQTAINAFADAPDVAKLSAARTAWQTAYLSYQRVAMFEFGPAETELIRTSINSFPLFTDRLNQTIAAGAAYDLNTPTLEYARGFPALDYLLYGVAATDADIVAMYSSDPQAAARSQYLRDVASHLQGKSQRVFDAWRADNGNYLLTFTTNTGVSTGTSVSFLVNQLSANYETVKNAKLGTPIGAKVSYIAAPNKVEAFYSGISLDLALEAVDASQKLFLGIGETTATDGIGLADYLNAVETEREETGTPLATTISAQFDLARQQLEALRPLGTLSQAITDNINAVKLPYAAVVNQIVYLKTDIPSLLCVSITYSDMTDDGD